MKAIINQPKYKQSLYCIINRSDNMENIEMMIESKLAEVELSNGAPVEVHEKIKDEWLHLLLAFYLGAK